MANSEKQDVIVDKEIPIEMQVDFLRKQIFDRDLVTYKVLKDKLGEKADDIYFTIKEDLLQQMIGDLGMELDFEDIKKQAGAPDKILGYRLEKDYEKSDEIQFSMLNCPFWERAKKYGSEKDICKIVCDWEAQQAPRMGCEMSMLSRIAEGDEKCTIRLRITK